MWICRSVEGLLRKVFGILPATRTAPIAVSTQKHCTDIGIADAGPELDGEPVPGEKMGIGQQNCQPTRLLPSSIVERQCAIFGKAPCDGRLFASHPRKSARTLREQWH